MEYKSHCIWIFGKQKTGKTTTACNLIQKKLKDYILIDGDKFRKSRIVPLGYSKADVLKNNEECLRMVKFLISEGRNVIVSMVTPLIESRKLIKKELGDACLRIMLTCKEETREKRGDLNPFRTDLPFEIGEHDFLLDTSIFSEEEVRDNILKIMQEKRLIE